MFKFYNLGMDCHVQSVPCIAPLAIAGITAGAGIVNSLISSKTQSSANKQYLQGIRETNQANKELYEKQMNDVRENNAIQRGYDSPAMQLARLRQAGINSANSITGDVGQPIQSVTAHPQVAPEQTPNPFGNMNLGGISQDAIAAYQSGQQIKDMDMSLYQHGIDSAFYYDNAVQKLSEAILENQHRSNRNKSDDIELEQLIFKRDKMMDEWEIHMRQANDEHNSALASQRLADANFDKIYADIAISNRLADIQDSMARVEWKRVSNESRRLSYEVKDMILGWKKDIIELKRTQMFDKFHKELMSLDLIQRKVAALMIYDDYFKNHQEVTAPAAKFLRELTGFDFKDLLGAAGAIIFGRVLGKGLRNPNTNPYSGTNASYSY